MHSFLTTMRSLVSRKWLIPTLVVLLGMVFLARLGIWQLDRLEQRRAHNAELRLALFAPALELTGVDLPEEGELLKDRNVMVQGEYDLTEQVVWKLQNWSGYTGVHLITPLKIAGSDSVVLVDRGWIPASESEVEGWSLYDETGLVTVNGYIALTQTLVRLAEGSNPSSGPQKAWYRVDIDAIQEQMPYELLPFYISQAPSEADGVEPPYRREREIDLSEGSHLGYAIQWFLFSLMLGVIYIIYVNKARQEATGDGE